MFPGADVRYTALTYCWGTSPFFRTTKSNLADLTSNFPWNNLAKNFQDAIIVTRWLGIRYLWIDALCIVQDDKGDWDRQSAKWGDIYANSYLTISATRSVAAGTGFLHHRAGSCKVSDAFESGFYVKRIPLHDFLGSLLNPYSRARDFTSFWLGMVLSRTFVVQACATFLYGGNLFWMSCKGQMWLWWKLQEQYNRQLTEIQLDSAHLSSWLCSWAHNTIEWFLMDRHSYTIFPEDLHFLGGSASGAFWYC